MYRARWDNVSRSSVTVLLNYLDEIVGLLNVFRYLKDDREVYVTLHNIFHYIISRNTLTSSNYVMDPRLQSFMSKVLEFLLHVQQLQSEYVASTNIIAEEVYRLVQDKLRAALSSKHIHVFVCDALSIVDALFIAYKLKPRFFGIIINPSGKTTSYKFHLDPKKFLENEENLSLMNAVGRALNVGTNISKFDDIDRFIHENEDVDFNDALTIINKLYNIVLSFYTKVKQLITHNIITVIVSDHGYDIESASSRYRLKHGLGPNTLSILAPILII
jgi:hypothetical protein